MTSAVAPQVAPGRLGSSGAPRQPYRHRYPWPSIPPVPQPKT